jgi:hypothetical protein
MASCKVRFENKESEVSNMKRSIAIGMASCFLMGMLLGGCVGTQQAQQPVQNEPQQEEPVAPQGEIETLIGEFQGLADSHSVEILVEGEPQEYQFFDDDIAAAFEGMDTGTAIQFDVETTADNTLPTIIKLYEAPAQG